jgi:hypothetical protein
MHGTRMAFVGSAPVNGWGAVGFWPGARIVSIRAMPRDGGVFPFQTYADAIFQCATWRTTFHVVAINLSMACSCEPTDYERQILEDRVTRAHANDISVIAAAGNTAGAVGSPAREAGVIAVAGGDPRGELCSFSSRGTGVDLVGPGCETELADPNTGALWAEYSAGTSGASMSASVTLAVLRSYRPDLDWAEAERLLISSGRRTTAGVLLDVETHFRNAGLGELVDSAKARRPSTAPVAQSPTAPSEVDTDQWSSLDPIKTIVPASLAQFHPRVELLRRRGRSMWLRVAVMPAGARLEVSLEERRGEFAYTKRDLIRAPARSARFSLPRQWRGGRVRLAFSFRGVHAPASPATYVRVNR